MYVFIHQASVGLVYTHIYLLKISKMVFLLCVNFQMLNLIHETFLRMNTNINHLTGLCIIYTNTIYIYIYIYETIYSAKKLALSVQRYVFHIAQRENLSSFIAELHLI